jgi:hypothetical protein
MGEGQPSTGPILLSWAVAAVAAVAETYGARPFVWRGVVAAEWISAVGSHLCAAMHYVVWAVGLPAEPAWPWRPLPGRSFPDEN